MVNNKLVFFFILFSSNYATLFSQSVHFFGKIEYSHESLLASGVYKEFQKTFTCFNDTSQCTQQIQQPVDIEAMVANQMKNIIQGYKKYNIAIDSFEMEKQKRKTRIQIEESLKTRDSLPYTVINYGNYMPITRLKIGITSYCVTDSFIKPNWSLLNDTVTIDGLFCQKATGMIAGKLYEVWFAPSIPFGAGPSIMCGLPGIVVLVTSEDKKRRYKLSKLEYPLSNSVEYGICANEKRISKADFFQIQEKFRKEKEQRIEEIKKNYQ